MPNKTLTDHLGMLSGDLIRPSTKEKVKLATLDNLDAVVLYFGGPWCRCGRPNKKELKRIYQEINDPKGEKRLEFIFAQWRGVRPDIRSISESTWDEYMADMPWLTLNATQSSSVSSFKSSCAPTFLAFCLRDGLVTEVRGDMGMLLRDHGAAAFPFTSDREAEIQGFFDSCMSGDAVEVKRLLDVDPSLANRAAPREWHAYHIMKKGWQPVTGSPGVKNADGSLFLIANHPAYGLHLAAGNGHTEVIKVLVEASANLEVGDGDGDTALAWAAWTGRRETMDQLLGAGCDPSFAGNLSRQQFEGVNGDGASLMYLKETIKSSDRAP